MDTLIGHSFGQLAAMCISEVLTLADTLTLVSGRARLMRDCWTKDTGVMMAIECERTDLETLMTVIRDHDLAIDVACYNGPRSFVLAGTSTSVQTLEQLSANGSIKPRPRMLRLKNSHAFHSRLIDDISPALLDTAQPLEYRKMRIPLETCTESESWTDFDARGMVKHSRDPVYFSAAVARIARRADHCTWIDVGSASQMGPLIQRATQDLTSTTHSFVGADLGSHKGPRSLAAMTCSLWQLGLSIQPLKQHPAERASFNLPSYAFEKNRFWLEYISTPSAPVVESTAPVFMHGLLHPISSTGGGNSLSFLVNTHNETFRTYTMGHAVVEQSLCPASVYAEIVAEGLSSVTSTLSQLRIRQLSIKKPLGLHSDSVYLHIEQASSFLDLWQFTVSSSSDPSLRSAAYASGEAAIGESKGSIQPDVELRQLQKLVSWNRVQDLQQRPDVESMNGRFIYKSFGEVVNYAAFYQGVHAFSAADLEAVGRVRLPENTLKDPRKQWINVIAADNFLQVAGIHINCWRPRNAGEVFMCTEIKDVSFGSDHMSSASQREWLVYACLDVIATDEVEYDIFVLDSSTKKLSCLLKGVHFHSVNFKSLKRVLGSVNATTKTSERESITDHAPASVAPSKNLITKDQAESTKPIVNGDATGQHTEANGISPVVEIGKSPSDTFSSVQGLLCEIMEVDAAEIQPSTNLEELGIDSLMVTEVLREIKARFAVDLSPQDFSALETVEELSTKINPSSSSSAHAASGAGNPSKTEGSSKQTAVPSEPLSTSSDVTLDSSRSNLAEAAQQSFSQLRLDMTNIMRQHQFASFYAEVHPLQSTLVVKYVVDAFEHMGCPLSRLQEGESLPQLQYAKQHTKVMRQMYRILEDARVVRLDAESGAAVRTAHELPAESAASMLERILSLHPQHKSEHLLLQTTGRLLGPCLQGTENPTSLIFADASARALLSDVYASAPMFKSGSVLLARYLDTLLGSLPRDRPVHILELGAGTGGTTRFLLDALAPRGFHITYTFTDLSSSLVVAAKKKFKDMPFMRYQVMDIEKEPAAADRGKYDIVISTNCIHATKSLQTSTANIHQLLRPDGVLCLVELTQNLYWFDLVFGLLEGWWLFNDGRQHVLASEELWRQNLADAGYKWVSWSDGPSKESSVLRVITASKTESALRDESGSSDLGTSTISADGTVETFTYKRVDGLDLQADLHYPAANGDDSNGVPRPVG